MAEILNCGTRFLGLAPKMLANIYTGIAAISGMMGAAERGEQEIARMQKEIAVIRDSTRSQLCPRVFCEEWGKPLIASQSWVAELVEDAGGEFVGQPGIQCEMKYIEQEDPDVLVAAWCGAGHRVPLQKIIEHRGWGEMCAAQ